MKLATLTLITLLSITCRAQTSSTADSSWSLINSIFDKIQAQGVDTDQPLLYGYFFFDKDKSNLQKIEVALIKLSYKFVEIEQQQGGGYMLHVEKIEQLTRQALNKVGQTFKQLASEYNIISYDGFDVGNPDPSKPLISKQNFLAFISTKKGVALFNTGIKLYDLDIPENAEIVFRECIRQHICIDTAYYKLGNILIELGKVEEGIKQLQNAVQANPGYVAALYNLGATFYDNSSFEKSIEYYSKADKLKPGSDDIIYGIAASEYAAKHYKASQEHCTIALQLNPGNENAKVLLGMLKEKLK